MKNNNVKKLTLNDVRKEDNNCSKTNNSFRVLCTYICCFIEPPVFVILIFALLKGVL